MTHRILSTKTLTQKQIAYATAAGLELECTEVISTGPCYGEAEIALIQAAATAPKNILITSSKSVALLQSLLPQPPAHWRIACISGKTSEAIGRWLGHDAIVAQGIDAKRLLISLQGEAAADWLFLCGRQRLPTLPNGLKDQGKTLTECVLYDTFALNPVLPGYFDGYMFYSPSGVRSFFMHNRPASSAVLMAIGASTATALYSYSSNELLIAPQPSPEHMIDTLKKYYATK